MHQESPNRNDIFSKRQKKLRGEMPDVYNYEEIPRELRAQVEHIIKDTFGEDRGSYNKSTNIYQIIYKFLCKEHGLRTLTERKLRQSDAIFEYFHDCSNYEHCLDVIEICFSIIQGALAPIYQEYKQGATSKQSPDDAIEELNRRFKENGVGYEFASGKLIRIDSQVIHSEVVKPVLSLLNSNEMYTGANQEFLRAHEHYRHSRYKECLGESLKSLESLMKGICKQHSWECKKGNSATELINICLDNGLIPEYLQNQFSSLRTILKSGVPTIRNKKGAHGQGHKVEEVPEHLAGYALHLTASNLLFLMQCNEQIN